MNYLLENDRIISIISTFEIKILFIKINHADTNTMNTVRSL